MKAPTEEAMDHPGRNSYHQNGKSIRHRSHRPRKVKENLTQALAEHLTKQHWTTAIWSPSSGSLACRQDEQGDHLIHIPGRALNSKQSCALARSQSIRLG